jgi:hypothetical protein
VLSVAACSKPALADETKLTVGHGVICDTAEEVKAMVSPAESDMHKRLVNVNDHYGKEACNIVTVAYFRGDEESTMLIPDGIVHVVKVQVVGFKSGPMWLRMNAPMDQYTAILEAALST